MRIRKLFVAPTVKLYIVILLLAFLSFPPFPSYASQENRTWNEMKIETQLMPLYAFTNKISYFESSKNGQKFVIQSTGLKSGETFVHVADAGGTNVEEVFSPGVYTVEKKTITFTAIHQLPSISGDGRYVCMGVQSNESSATKKTDYILVFDTVTKKQDFFPLRILVPGTNQVLFSSSFHQVPNIDIDPSGEYITAQVEIGYITHASSWTQTAILVMNRNGSNQKVVAGPKEFSRTQQSFVYNATIHSPHLPRFAQKNSIVFYAQLFENTSPYDLRGELFAYDLTSGFLNQLTSSRRFDPKPEELGPFVLNMYGTKVFFKMFVEGVSMVSSIATDGTGLTHIIPLPKESPFCISGDGNKVFFIDEHNQNSLVYISLLTSEKFFVLDKTTTGEPLRGSIYHSLDTSSLPIISHTTFTGNTIFYTVSSHTFIRLDLLPNIIAPRNVSSVFEKNRSVIMINDNPVSVFSSPYIKNNRIMIPLSIITKYYGMQYFPNLTRGILQVTYNANYYIFYTGSATYIKNGAKYTLPQPIEINRNEPFFPGGSVPDVFSFQIQWDSITESLTVIR
ncbi:MAG: copper amine oxidase N-terminal domain-containing protein [Caldisericia bacterium]|nr:copper amine oxidase N-terminal domain-containing protein [Caldisericia bacterium]MDD4613925.1 copper amine oxidase N-terminal domain-containing protein [Caldisericia bacterium]